MNRYKKMISLFIVFIIVTTTMSGCYNYKEVNNTTFTTSMIYDVDDLGNVIVYMDCVRPYRNTSESSDNGKRILYKGTGKTTLEAIRDINLASSF